jgi:hypothetical protein
MDQTLTLCRELDHIPQEMDAVVSAILLASMSELVIEHLLKDVEQYAPNLAQKLKITWQTPPTLTV